MIRPYAGTVAQNWLKWMADIIAKIVAGKNIKEEGQPSFFDRNKSKITHNLTCNYVINRLSIKNVFRPGAL